MNDLEEKIAKLPAGSKEFIDLMVGLQAKAYDDGMEDAINIIIQAIDRLQLVKGLQVLTMDEIRHMLNEAKYAARQSN